MPTPLYTSGTDIKYNGVVLRDCLTSQFDQIVEYDASNTDRLFTRFVISVESFVTDFENTVLGNGLHESFGADGTEQKGAKWSAANTANRMRYIQELLSVPRRQFEMYHEGRLVMHVVSQPAGGGGTDGAHLQFDLDNGPKPKNVQVVQVIPNRAYRIKFNIELCVLTCETGGGSPVLSVSPNEIQGNVLLTNRFVIDEVRDGNFYNTRIMMGRARVAHSSLWNLATRTIVTPPLSRGYKRDSSQFTVDYNGLDMTYRFVDKQRYAAPPWPATEFRGVHQETSDKSGVRSFGAIQLKVWGAPDGNKRSLYEVALAVIQSRIGKFGEVGKDDAFVIAQSVSITDVLHEMCIEVAVQFERHGGGVDEKTLEQRRWVDIMLERLGLLPAVAILQLNPENQGENGSADWYRFDGRPPNEDEWPLPTSQWDDGAPYGIFASYLQDGCSPTHGAFGTSIEPENPGGGGGGGGEEPPEEERRTGGRTDRRLVSSVGGDPPKSNDQKGEDKVSEEQTKIPYTHIEVRSDYPQDYGYVGLPKFTSSYTPEDGDVLITKLHAATAKKVVFITAKRIGGQPKIPEIKPVQYDKNGIVYVLDEFHPEFVAPTLLPDRVNFEYEQNIRLVYIMSRALKPTDTITLGSLPWDITTKTDETNLAKLDTENQSEELNPIVPETTSNTSTQR